LLFSAGMNYNMWFIFLIGILSALSFSVFVGGVLVFCCPWRGRYLLTTAEEDKESYGSLRTGLGIVRVDYTAVLENRECRLFFINKQILVIREVRIVAFIKRLLAVKPSRKSGLITADTFFFLFYKCLEAAVLFRKLLTCFHFFGSAHIVFGFDNPCQTGQYLGLFAVLHGHFPGLDLRVSPDFTQEIFQFSGEGGVDFSLPRLGITTLQCLLQPEGIRLVTSTIRGIYHGSG